MAAGPMPTQALPTLLTSRPRVSPILKGLAKDPVEERPSATASQRLPEAYAMPIRVRNTFIDTSAERSPSLERFYREREVSTCPSAHIGRFSRLFEEAEVDACSCRSDDDKDTQLPSESHETRSASEVSPSNAAHAGPGCILSLAEALNLPTQPPSAPVWGGQLAYGDGLLNAEVAAVEVPCENAFCDWSLSWGEIPPAQYGGSDVYFVEVPCSGFGDWPVSWQESPPMQGAPFDVCFAECAPSGLQHEALVADVATANGTPLPPAAQAPVPPVEVAPPVAAAPAVPAPPSQPAPGCAEMPSVGSALHKVGECKPCAFFHTVGCGNGVTCEFCHLCGPDERKRRRKAKMDSLRAERSRKAGRDGAAA